MRITKWPKQRLDDFINMLEGKGYKCPTMTVSQSIPKGKNGLPRKQVITLEFTNTGDLP